MDDAASSDAAPDERLGQVIAAAVAALEKRVEDGLMTLSDVRMLTELCRAEEIRMRPKRNEKAAKAHEKKHKDGGPDYRDDPEWILSEINRRLDRLGRREESQAEGDGASGEGGGR